MNVEELVHDPKIRYSMDVIIDQIIDETDPNCVYVGWSQTFGAATSAACWKIKRIKVADGVTSIGWAPDPEKFSNVWDNKASLTYTQGG